MTCYNLIIVLKNSKNQSLLKSEYSIKNIYAWISKRLILYYGNTVQCFKSSPLKAAEYLWLLHSPIYGQYSIYVETSQFAMKINCLVSTCWDHWSLWIKNAKGCKNFRPSRPYFVQVISKLVLDWFNDICYDNHGN